MNQEIIKKNPEGYDYIPIEEIENLLDEKCKDWNIHKFKISQVGQKITAEIELYYQLTKNISGTNRIGVSEMTIKEFNNTPFATQILKSECVKNAAKSISEEFGRMLNRGMEENTGNTAKTLKPASVDIVKMAIKEIKCGKSRKERDEIYYKIIAQLEENFLISGEQIEEMKGAI